MAPQPPDSRHHRRSAADSPRRTLVPRPTKGGYGPLNPILFSPQKSSSLPHIISPQTSSRRGGHADRSRRKGGAPAANQLGGVRRAGFSSFVQNEPLECTLPVQERFRSSSIRCEARLLPSLRARLAIKRWTRHPRSTVHPLPLTFGYVHDRIAFISLHHSRTPDCSRSQIYHQPR